MKGKDCKRCGICCYVDMTAYSSDEDLKRWELEQREDILHSIERKASIWAGDRLISSRNGHSILWCPFLDVVDGGLFACSIYDTRPSVCKNFKPGVSKMCTQCAE